MEASFFPLAFPLSLPRSFELQQGFSMEFLAPPEDTRVIYVRVITRSARRPSTANMKIHFEGRRFLERSGGSETREIDLSAFRQRIRSNRICFPSAQFQPHPDQVKG